MSVPTKQFLVHITGHDEPGITATITRHFGDINVRILDIEQTVVFHYLSLHFHISVAEEFATSLEQDLAKRLAAFTLAIHVKPVTGMIEIPDPALRFVTTIIANNVHPNFIADLTSTIASFDANIDSIRKLNNGGLETIELICSSKQKVNLPQVSEALLNVAVEYPDIDLAVQRENLYRRSKRLVAFDMDSTLIQGEVIDELAARKGCKAEVEALTKDAMEGRIDFRTSITERVKLLKGVNRRDMEAVANELKLTPGANTLIKVLKKLGFKIALISGGFTYFAERLKNDLGLHYVYANKLEFDGNECTGQLDGIIVDAQRKADLLEMLAQQEDISLDQVIAIGDGANDVLMLKRAGLGIAFNAKPITRAHASTALTKKSMTSILYLLGITDNEIQEMGYKVSNLNSQRQVLEEI